MMNHLRAAFVALAFLAVLLPAPARAQSSNPGYDSGPISVAQAVANSSHAAGTSIGGLFPVPIARLGGSGAGNSGIITSVLWKSLGGSTGSLVLRMWSRQPTGTTCTDNVAFVGNNADDAFLIGAGPVTITPAAPGIVTGDAATYASLTGLTWDFATASGSKNVYACLVTVAIDTADQNTSPRLTLSGVQN